MNILRLAAALTWGAVIAAAGPILRIQDLGTLGGSQMSGMAINPSGEIAGYGSNAFGDIRAFTASSSLNDITPVASGGAAAYGVNGSGQVVGRTFVNGNSQATLWSNGTAQTIGGLGGPDSYANAINNRQQIAGMATDLTGRGRAVIYSAGAVKDVSLPGATWSSAYAINSSGAIAGYAMSAAGAFQAYTWSAGAGYSSLGTLGGRNSYAFGINDHGEVAGNSSVSTGYSHAFRADANGMHDLGTLGGNSSNAYGINNSGSVVGWSWTAAGVQHAFIYMGGAIVDLNSIVSNLTGWELTQAYAINDAGQIAGTGLFHGVEHAFRLDPLPPQQTFAALLAPKTDAAVPEPGTTALMLLGLTSGWLLKRHRR